MLKRFFLKIAGFFDNLRKILINFLFWGIVLLLLLFFIGRNCKPQLEENSALFIDLGGKIYERNSDCDAEKLLEGNLFYQTVLLRDLTKAVEAAADDTRIEEIYMDMSGFYGWGFGQLQELRSKLLKFKESGKKITAYADAFSQSSYYLVSCADTITMDPLGTLRFPGFTYSMTFIKNLLDRCDIGINVFRAGESKSSTEPFTRENISDAVKENISRYLAEIWTIYRREVSASRNISEKAFSGYVKNYAEILEKAGGSSAAAALEYKLIDKIASSDEIEKAAKEKHRTELSDYLFRIKKEEKRWKDKIAVITASGNITEDGAGPETISGKTYKKLIENISEDPNIKALVFRIDSGGGSVTGSEQIRKALKNLKAKGIPVIVSMSSTATSGAYWISTAADEIWAAPGTLTGSIGVFSLYPDISRFLEKKGITSDRISAEEEGNWSWEFPMSDKEKRIRQAEVDHLYDTFIKLVAVSRNMEESDVRKIADGKIWSGEEASKKRLVDCIGFLDDALISAAEKAGLRHYSIVYHEPGRCSDMGSMRKIIKNLMADIAPAKYKSFSFASGADL